MYTHKAELVRYSKSLLIETTVEKKKKVHFLFFMYLVVPGLSCGMWNLLGLACGILCPSHRLNAGPLHWERSLSHRTIREVHKMHFL